MILALGAIGPGSSSQSSASLVRRHCQIRACFISCWACNILMRTTFQRNLFPAYLDLGRARDPKIVRGLRAGQILHLFLFALKGFTSSGRGSLRLSWQGYLTSSQVALSLGQRACGYRCDDNARGWVVLTSRHISMDKGCSGK